MAKIMMGPILSAASGKVGGTVFSSNYQGLYVRRKSVPGAPTTPATQAAKNKISATAKSWVHGLTQPQRADWISAAIGITIYDRFGNPQKLSGEGYFLRVNANLRLVRAAGLLHDPPVDVPLLIEPPPDQLFTDSGPITLTNISGDPMHPDVTVTPTTGPQPTDAVIIRAKRPVSRGRHLPHITGASVLMAIYTPTSPPWDITEAYTFKYEELPPYYGILVELSYIRATNGAQSQKYAALIIPD